MAQPDSVVGGLSSEASAHHEIEKDVAGTSLWYDPANDERGLFPLQKDGGKRAGAVARLAWLISHRPPMDGDLDVSSDPTRGRRFCGGLFNNG